MDQVSPEEKRLLLDQYLRWSDFDGVFVLSPEWSVDVPLWPQSDAIDEFVPKTLQEKLTVWQDIFDSNYKWGEGSRQEGWLSKDAKDEWEQAVPGLVAELTSVLEGRARLIVDLWPITPSEKNHELQEYRRARKSESDHWQRLLKEAGIELSLRSPFYDETGRPKGNPSKVAFNVGNRVLVSGGYDRYPDWLQGGRGYSGTIRELRGKYAVVELDSELSLPSVARRGAAWRIWGRNMGDPERINTPRGKWLLLAQGWIGSTWTEPTDRLHVVLCKQEPSIEAAKRNHIDGAWVESHGQMKHVAS